MKLKYSAKAHGYWLDGKRCKSPSAVAKVPDDSSSLDKWRRRQTARGLALRPDLTTKVATATNDRELDTICEEAMDAAGAGIGRDRGSSVHRITELIDDGSTILETPEVQQLRNDWQRLLADHQLTVAHIEGVIVHPNLWIAGRFDRIVEHTPTGRRFILDVKTGASANRYLHAHAIQLWLYASAPLFADGPGGDVDFELDNWQPLERIDQQVGLIAHLPADGKPSIIPVDIAAGGRCFTEVIEPTWAWRARTDLQVELPGSDGDRRQELRDRCRALVAANPEAGKRLAATLRAENIDVRTTAHLDRVEQLLDEVATPRHQRTAVTRSHLDGPPPDEGDELTEADFEHLRTRAGQLPENHRAWLRRLTAEGRNARRPFSLPPRGTQPGDGNRYTRRRGLIFNTLVTLAEAEFADDDIVRGLVAETLGVNPDDHATTPAGDLLSALGADQAANLLTISVALSDGLRTVTITDGRLRLHAA